MSYIQTANKSPSDCESRTTAVVCQFARACRAWGGFFTDRLTARQWLPGKVAFPRPEIKDLLNLPEFRFAMDRKTGQPGLARAARRGRIYASVEALTVPKRPFYTAGMRCGRQPDSSAADRRKETSL